MKHVNNASNKNSLYLRASQRTNARKNIKNSGVIHITMKFSPYIHDYRLEAKGKVRNKCSNVSKSFIQRT